MKNCVARGLMMMAALFWGTPLVLNAGSSQDPVVSKWNWGGTVVTQVFENGRARMDAPGLIMEGQWSLVSRGGANQERKYVINWNGGQWIDSVSLSMDHQHLFGRNQVGWPINAVRISRGGGTDVGALDTTAESKPGRRGVTIMKLKPIETPGEEIGEVAVATPAVEKDMGSSSSVPKSATVVSPPEETNPDYGNIRVAFADGHSEMWTKGGQYSAPHVSATGDVGWSRPDKRTGDRYRRNADILHLHFHDGSIKEFKPNNLFIINWAFASRDSEVVIESMAHHGPMSYIKYDIKTGRVTGEVPGYTENLPHWAEIFGN